MKILTAISIIIIHLCDNRGEVKFNITDEAREYRVNKIRYIVTAAFDDDSNFDLIERFKRLIENSQEALTDEEDHVTINSEFVSAVGKDANE